MSTHTQSSHEQRAQWKSRLQERTFHLIYEKTLQHPKVARPPTASERQFIILGFMLSVFSIVTSFFPVAGLPVAISGLVMGLTGRRITALERVATWTICLSVLGLVLSMVNIMIGISIYLSFYLWQ